MTTRQLIFAIIGIGAAALLASAACGRDDEPATKPEGQTSGAPTAAAQPATPPAPAAATAFGDTLSGPALAWHRTLPHTTRNDIEFFALAAGREAAGNWVDRALANGDFTFPPIPLSMPLPPVEDTLSQGELDKLEALDVHVRDPFLEMWEFGVRVVQPYPRPDDPKAYVEAKVAALTSELRDTLSKLPAALPPANDILRPDMLAEYEKLHPQLQERFWIWVGTKYAQSITVGKGEFPPLSAEEVKDLFGQLVPPLTAYQRDYHCVDPAGPCPAASDSAGAAQDN